MTRSVHKDLGIVMSDDLSWNQHYKKIIPKAYRMLGLLRHCFSQFQSVFAKRILYLSLVRSQVMYCSIVWRSSLIKDIILVERIQRRATKFILNDHNSSYFDRLKKLNLLPLMYIFEVLFTIKSLKYPSSSFNITDYITFKNGFTRSSSSGKLNHVRNSNNVNKHFFFNRITRLWNALPPNDLSLSISTNKTRIYRFLWEHFLTNFNSDNP